MRKWIALAALITVVVVPATVVAQSRAGRVSGAGTATLNRQAYHFLTGDSQTTSQSFSSIPGLGREVCATGNVMATITLNLSGSVAEVRVVDHAPSGGQIMHPSLAHVNPTTGTNTFSFSFVEQLGSAHLHTFNPEWRSTTGGPVHLRGGALILQFGGSQSGC